MSDSNAELGGMAVVPRSEGRKVGCVGYAEKKVQECGEGGAEGKEGMRQRT